VRGKKSFFCKDTLNRASLGTCEYEKKCSMKSGPYCTTGAKFDCAKYLGFRKKEEEEQMRLEDDL
jgi:hypothetical protein